MAANWIDVSVPLYSGMVHWPDNPPVEIELQLSIERGDAANVSKLSMGTHTGTHMDAPHHFIQSGAGIDTMPPDAGIGPARVIEIADPESITPDELREKGISRGERILFKTRNSMRDWGQIAAFDEHFVYISAAAAQYLAEVGVQTVGVDYLSVGGFFRDGSETHHALLEAGIWIIEGLYLGEVSEGEYDLVCLPIKIRGGDGAPARAVLRARG